MNLAATQDINTVLEQFNNDISSAGKIFTNPDIFYSLQLLDTIRYGKEEYVYYRYAKESPIKNKGNKLSIRRWAPLEAHTIPLLEGVPPQSDKGSAEVYEVPTAQYGRYMEFTDKTDFKLVDPVIAHYAAEYSLVAMETLDKLAREALFSVSNKVYAGYVQTFEDLDMDSKPSMTDLRKIILSLSGQLVKPVQGSKYHVIAGEEFYYDMIDDPTVEKYMSYNQDTKTMYSDSMLVPMFNMEFYSTRVCPTNGRFYKDGKQALRIVAEDGAGGYVYKTLTEDTTIKTSTDATGVTPVAGKRAGGYIVDPRTGFSASYIPEDSKTVAEGAEVVFDLAAFNDAANATDGATSIGNDEKEWFEFRVQKVLVLGKDALIRTGIEGRGNAKMYTKPLGSSGVLDPINQRQSIGFKIDDVGFGSSRLEAIVEYDCVPTQVNVI